MSDASTRPAAPAPRRQRRAEHTQGRLLDAALSAFLERGYDALVLGEVTQRADLGTGTLYLHFRDKRALYEAVVRRALGEVYARWLKVGASGRSARERVLAMVRTMIAFLAERPQQARLFLVEGPAVESFLVDEVTEHLATYLEGSQRELRASLIVGAALAAGRHWVRSGQKPGARAVVDTTLAFCAHGLGGAPHRAGKAKR